MFRKTDERLTSSSGMVQDADQGELAVGGEASQVPAREIEARQVRKKMRFSYDQPGSSAMDKGAKS